VRKECGARALWQGRLRIVSDFVLIGQVELIVEANEHHPEPKGKQRVNLTEASGETERTERKPKEHSACPLCVEPSGEGVLKESPRLA
jgi:hypothetical protein